MGPARSGVRDELHDAIDSGIIVVASTGNHSALSNFPDVCTGLDRGNDPRFQSHSIAGNADISDLGANALRPRSFNASAAWRPWPRTLPR